MAAMRSRYGPQLQLNPHRGPKGRRSGMRQNLLDRIEVKPGFPLDLPDALSIPKYPLSNLTPLLHVPKHSLPPPLAS